MEFVKLDIAPSGSYKRDCELIDFKFFPDIVVLFKRDSDQSNWKLVFDDYFAIKITSEEFAIHLTGKDIPNEGSFYTVGNSTWIAELSKTDNQSLEFAKHYILFFYDEVIEIVSSRMTFELINLINNV